MKIDDKSLDLLRLEQLRGNRANGAEGGANPVPAISPVTRTDRVQISDAGRFLAAQGGEASTLPLREPLGAEQTAEIRRRVLTGAYDSLGVIEQVARRMLERGDI